MFKFIFCHLSSYVNRLLIKILMLMADFNSIQGHEHKACNTVDYFYNNRLLVPKHVNFHFPVTKPV